jgi:predicted AAA+ superfamily ATPase
MQQGGFPELLANKDHKSYVKNLVDNILTRDIEQRYKIQYKAAFKAMSQHLLNVAPVIVAAPDLANTFRFKSEHTVRNYIDYLKQAYLLIGVQKYSQKSKIRQTGEKVYTVDVAMMNQRDNAFAGENLGYRLETAVLIHLVRKSKLEGTDIYYLNERYGECDFLVCKNNQVMQAIQVSYDISVEKTRKREVNGLLLAAKLTGCKNLLLLTDHEYGETEEAGYSIKIQPVYDWSLELGI